MPTKRGTSYPNAEVVLINCALAGISPVGWGTVSGDTSNVHTSRAASLKVK